MSDVYLLLFVICVLFSVSPREVFCEHFFVQTLRFTWCWVWRFLVQLCPHTCTCRHTHECGVTPQLLQLCPHTCTCRHTRVQCYHPLPPASTAVSPHLYMLLYTCLQCYPPPPTATPAAVPPHLYMLSYTCVQCYLPPPPLPTSPIVHALIHTGAVLPSTTPHSYSGVLEGGQPEVI